MTDTTPRAALPLIAAAQAQKQVAHDEALLQLDALLFARFLDRDLTAPPASPAEGDCYLVHATATGLWATHDGAIAFFADGAWKFYAPFTGLAAYVVDEAKLIVFTGAAWADYATILQLQNVPLLGVNATADTTNKFAVKSAALLFDNIGNGVQAKFNKHASADTASFLYQTNFSGRAEIGLTGDDDFHVKVSPDGTNWFETLKLARAGGALTAAGTIAPEANNTRDLGSASAAFRTAYLGTSLGIGMAPVNVLDIAQNVSGPARINLLNGSTSGAAVSRIAAANGTSVGSLSQFGSSYVPSGMSRPNGTYLEATGAGGLSLATAAAQPIYFGINNSEAARIDAAGNLLVGRTTPYNQCGAIQISGNGHIFDFVSSHASNPNGITIDYSACSPNGTANDFLVCADTGGVRMTLRSNGGIANYSANNVNLSDRDRKNVFDIAPPQLDVIRDTEIRLYEYVDAVGKRNWGMIAQQALGVDPTLVNAGDDAFGINPGTGKPYLSLFESQLPYRLWRGMQEMLALADGLAAGKADRQELEAVRARLARLEAAA